MFGHNGDDYDEELVANDKFMTAANQMFSENYNEKDIYRKLVNMKCDGRVARRICKFLRETDRQRRIRYEQFVRMQRDVKERNRKERELENSKEKGRKIGISKIRDDDDYERTR